MIIEIKPHNRDCISILKGVRIGSYFRGQRLGHYLRISIGSDVAARLNWRGGMKVRIQYDSLSYVFKLSSSDGKGYSLVKDPRGHRLKVTMKLPDGILPTHAISVRYSIRDKGLFFQYPI